MTDTERVRSVAWGRGEAEYRRSLILGGNVRGIVPAVYSDEDGEGRMLYSVGAFPSLEEWCAARELTAEELRWLMRSLAEIWKDAENCLIGPGAFFLGPEWIFLDADRGNVKLCAAPEDRDDFSDLQRTARLILEAIDYKEEACVELAYEFYHLCMKKLPSADEILAVADDAERHVFTDPPGLKAEPEQEPREPQGSGADDGWIDVRPQPVTAEEEKRRSRDARRKKIKSMALRILFAAAVVLIAAALLKAGF